MEQLSQILDRRIACPCGRTHETRTRVVHLEPSALSRLPAWLRDRGTKRPLVVADARTLLAAGDRVLALLSELDADVDLLVLPDDEGGHPPCADAGAVAAARDRAAAHHADLVVAVGAGTVNDVAKRGAFEAGVPYVTCPTAPSMNGYTSAIAAILADGVKRTIPAWQPEAVFADLDVLCAAPAVLRRAGFGDLCSKPYSNADWLLAHELRGEYYCAMPADLLDAPFRELLPHAAAIGRGEPDAVRRLSYALLLSGFSMALAGSSAPASGGEHLVSHYLDMVEHAAGRPVRALHGEQVGVATVLVGRLYDRLLALSPADIDVARLLRQGARTPAEREAEVRARHPFLPRAIVDEVVTESLKKMRSPEEREADLEHLRDTWPGLKTALSGILAPAAGIAKALEAAGARVKPSSLGLEPDTISDTLLVCRDIRARYTVLDLADELGLLSPFAHELAKEAD